jgi:hypothetical protein
VAQQYDGCGSHEITVNEIVHQYLAQYRKVGLQGGPATEFEISQLEQVAGLLPASYKAYLLIAGRKPPSFWIGSDCTLHHLQDLRDAADNLLHEDGQPPLPENAFVFLMHQGYQFFYFGRDPADDDPPVFYYLEGAPRIVKRFERFSELMIKCATEDHQE